ncbi:MAG: universal stress protein [Dehalococcoidia bacterium]|nr:universal stress protein [Dehalococcoidia bacterium]
MPRILVPLDESALAEQALPWAAALARGLGYDIHLISVYNFDEDAWKRVAIDPGDAPSKIAEEVTRYLEERAQQAELAGLTVTVECRLGSVAEQIAEAAGEGDTRLIAITSHGKGGFKRWLQGSVTDELVRTVTVPVLVIRANMDSHQFRKLLVTLDGSETSELALPVAREIANAAGAAIHLVRVVNPVAEVAWSGIGPAPDMGEITRQYADAAQAYLEKVSLQGETYEVMYGRPLDAILESARTQSCDVIAMGTHGRGGITRLALGSTTDAVVRASDRPVLVVPSNEPDE